MSTFESPLIDGRMQVVTSSRRSAAAAASRDSRSAVAAGTRASSRPLHPELELVDDPAEGMFSVPAGLVLVWVRVPLLMCTLTPMMRGSLSYHR